MAAELERSRSSFPGAACRGSGGGLTTSAISTGSKVTRRSRRPPSSGRAPSSKHATLVWLGDALWTRASRTPPSRCSRSSRSARLVVAVRPGTRGARRQDYVRAAGSLGAQLGRKPRLCYQLAARRCLGDGQLATCGSGAR
jgi:hypothetical protein